ncbi:hypothetical protein KP509_01G078000 [Ceratopteris richardii]|uniref:Uncharacterized protein n=1 Tax=Ceratopteris richardii TaxID=49495 RepID=A0A8T2VMP4_CERRI|nr:hypothetical protein KP509_01G078000 [Ceratopteris richardii]
MSVRFLITCNWLCVIIRAVILDKAVSCNMLPKHTNSL